MKKIAVANQKGFPLLQKCYNTRNGWCRKQYKIN